MTRKGSGIEELKKIIDALMLTKQQEQKALKEGEEEVEAEHSQEMLVGHGVIIKEDFESPTLQLRILYLPG